jgi:hypothetical protein
MTESLEDGLPFRKGVASRRLHLAGTSRCLDVRVALAVLSSPALHCIAVSIGMSLPVSPVIRVSPVSVPLTVPTGVLPLSLAVFGCSATRRRLRALLSSAALVLFTYPIRMPPDVSTS